MRWADFAHAVRAAAGILAERKVVVLGSQAIHATFMEEEPPANVDGVSMNTPTALVDASPSAVPTVLAWLDAVAPKT